MRKTGDEVSDQGADLVGGLHVREVPVVEQGLEPGRRSLFANQLQPGRTLSCCQRDPKSFGCEAGALDDQQRAIDGG